MLRSILKHGKYQIADESVVLDRQAAERVRRQEAGARRAAEAKTNFSRNKQPNLKKPNFAPAESCNEEVLEE